LEGAYLGRKEMWAESPNPTKEKTDKSKKDWRKEGCQICCELGELRIGGPKWLLKKAAMSAAA